jgi:hypothetical protein
MAIKAAKTPAANRMRRHRERLKAQSSAPLLFERSDWQLFLDPKTLPQKGGFGPDQIGRAILKELTDNALDSGAGDVTVSGDAKHCTISDDGPGLSGSDLLRVFAVNRPLVSSKYVRLPTRGMLGNGLRVVMGAVASFNGTLTVTSRGTRYELATDRVTGGTEVISSRPARPAPGLTVTLSFPHNVFADADFAKAKQTVAVARHGTYYDGCSQASWYSPEALRDLLAAAPKDRSLGAVVAEVFNVSGETPQTTLEWAAGFIAKRPPPRLDIGEIGAQAVKGYYRKVTGQTFIDQAKIPYCVECWVVAKTVTKEEGTGFLFYPWLNRSPALAQINGFADSRGLSLHGCGLVAFKVSGPKRAAYGIWLSLITPYLRLTGDGKAPYLGHFHSAIAKAVQGAAGEAYRNLVRPKGRMSIKDAAFAVIEEAYLAASANPGGERLPAKARQIMYQARPQILELTGKTNFTDGYFTQDLLPQFVQEFAEKTATWDIVYDARGDLVEPHTGRRVPLGTIEVRSYLGLRPSQAIISVRSWRQTVSTRLPDRRTAIGMFCLSRSRVSPNCLRPSGWPSVSTWRL